ncbi:ABC transporter ATP-binding protein [Caldilinea sp.]|uniref:ABC transporter ATP-binding protein n=1 Tax=Caldilinea sp. TaxID=2293560 RepID=UPI002CB86F09|nr:ABC transporter ATP-binding protein [Anaerolineales bacterium]HQY94294.1 ABC transporter ATP-binding protein [Caldilinea sp.]HRA64640.1 ABC transporter ATP-binding protein [Caldilinea sp.]
MLKSFRRMFVIYKGYRLRLVISQVLLLISATASISLATLNQQLINDGLMAGKPLVIIETGIWMVVLALVAGGAMAGTAAFAVFFAQGTAYLIRSELYHKIQTFSFANFDQFRTGNLLTRLSADVNYIANAVLYSVMLLLYAPFMIVVAFVLAWINTPSLIWVLVVVSIVVLAVMAVIVPQIFNAYAQRQQRLEELNNTLQENLAGVRVVKAFVREELEIERFKQRSLAMREPAFAAAFRVAALNPILTATAQIFTALTIAVGGRQVLTAAGLNVGELITFMQYLTLVVTPLAMLAIVVPFILRGDASASRVFEIVDAPPAVIDPPDAKTLDPAAIEGRLAFENVTFAFRRPDGQYDPPALKNISLTVEPGQRVGILGATGAGKTALVNLVPRFYDATQGRITIDGIDVRDFAQDNLRQIVGIALQEAVLFQGDVRFNLKFGNVDAPDETMHGAAQAADAYGFIANLPQTWEAPVARRGYNFSGGQRQRLAISRTLTTLPRVLILDDSTSALDVATESRVQAAIPGFTDNVTTIYIAQRISAVIDLDLIVLMENGAIVATGTHETLLAENPLYQEIYASQLGSGMTPATEERPAEEKPA